MEQRAVFTFHRLGVVQRGRTAQGQYFFAQAFGQAIGIAKLRVLARNKQRITANGARGLINLAIFRLLLFQKLQLRRIVVYG